MKILRNIPFGLDQNTTETFRYSRFETALLEPGDLIYRIYTPNHNFVFKTPEDVKNPDTEGMFWLDHFTYESLIKANQGEYIQGMTTRAMLAVKEEWSPSMSRIVTARVVNEIKAAYGYIKWQPLTSVGGDSNVILIGGGAQLYIMVRDLSNVTIISDRDIRPEAKVTTKLRF